VEFESNDLSLDGRNIDAEVELWDCSGDRRQCLMIRLSLRFEKCWPALQKGVHGVILVYDCDLSEHVDQLESWFDASNQALTTRYNTFVLRRGMRNNRVLVFAHTVPKADAQAKVETT